MLVEVFEWKRGKLFKLFDLTEWLIPLSRYMKFPQSDGHTEKLEIKEEGLGGVQWKTRENEGVLTKSSRKK